MRLSPKHFRAAQSAFTMVEIAISLAIIGIALVAIIGVLPLGMNVQKDNREQTVINEDATIFIEAIRNGERGSDDLTNYVYGITNYWTKYQIQPPQVLLSGVNGYTYSVSSVASPYPNVLINSGGSIVGLLSTPKYQNAVGQPLPNLLPNPNTNIGYSNHVVAYVRSMSGPAVEKPPQDNQILQQDSFGYRIICDNLLVQTDPNANAPYNFQINANLHELRLTFLWPQQPNGSLGAGRQTYRALIAGQFQPDTNSLFFYQPQSFVMDTNAP
jgi:prepilin-type N-terminal cleavage/methylation domain-containing protein